MPANWVYNSDHYIARTYARIHAEKNKHIYTYKNIKQCVYLYLVLFVDGLVDVRLRSL